MNKGGVIETGMELDLSRVYDAGLVRLVTSHADAIGVPKEYILFPLLGAVSGILGESKVMVNGEWQEACCLWTGVTACRGSR